MRDGGRVNYRRESLMIRERRDRAIEQARRELLELRAARNAEILRLHAEGLSGLKIAAELHCEKTTAYEMCDPERHAKANARRRDHWRRLRLEMAPTKDVAATQLHGVIALGDRRWGV